MADRNTLKVNTSRPLSINTSRLTESVMSLTLWHFATIAMDHSLHISLMLRKENKAIEIIATYKPILCGCIWIKICLSIFSNKRVPSSLTCSYLVLGKMGTKGVGVWEGVCTWTPLSSRQVQPMPSGRRERVIDIPVGFGTVQCIQGVFKPHTLWGISVICETWVKVLSCPVPVWKMSQVKL